MLFKKGKKRMDVCSEFTKFAVHILQTEVLNNANAILQTKFTIILFNVKVDD